MFPLKTIERGLVRLKNHGSSVNVNHSLRQPRPADTQHSRSVTTRLSSTSTRNGVPLDGVLTLSQVPGIQASVRQSSVNAGHIYLATSSGLHSGRHVMQVQNAKPLDNRRSLANHCLSNREPRNAVVFVCFAFQNQNGDLSPVNSQSVTSMHRQW